MVVLKVRSPTRCATIAAMLAPPAALCSDGRPCPGRRGRSSALRVFRCNRFCVGLFVWARRALEHQNRRFPPRAVELDIDDLRFVGRPTVLAAGEGGV